MNRFRIVGRLVTETPLHVGNGAVTQRGDGKTPAWPWNDKKKRPAEISAVATDANGSAYIPGSTLKGNIRSWLEMRLGATDRDRTKPLFGYLEATNGKHEGEGGKLEFLDAFCVSEDDLSQVGRAWDARRKTCVAASVAIDRTTRTADADKLFHYEFVPPGVKFEVAITGQNLEPSDLELVLLGLEGFNHGLRIGASSGDGWGQMRWELEKLERLGSGDLASWIEHAAADGSPGYGGLDALVSEAELEDLRAGAVRRLLALQNQKPVVTAKIELRFQSHFLVNEGSRTWKLNREEQQRDDSDEHRIPDHAPVRNRNGQAFLPASSFRGALRSQAERIYRTLGGRVDASPATPFTHEQIRALGPIDKLFGCTGWRSPVEISDFEPAAGSDYPEQTQHFVAIDRFTGGGANGKKFDARAVYKPVLHGKLSLDLEALAWSGGGAWSLALMILTLRDLLEGDVPFGFGSAKGYGACTARLTDFQVPHPWEAIPDALRQDLSSGDVPDLLGAESPNESMQVFLMYAFDELKTMARQQGVA